MDGHLEISPCVLQDIGLLGPLPCSHSTFWAAAPKGTKSCRTQGDFCSSFRHSVRSSPQALSGLKSALSGLKSTLSGLKSALSGLESAHFILYFPSSHIHISL